MNATAGPPNYVNVASQLTHCPHYHPHSCASVGTKQLAFTGSLAHREFLKFGQRIGAALRHDVGGRCPVPRLHECRGVEWYICLGSYLAAQAPLVDVWCRVLWSGELPSVRL